MRNLVFATILALLIASIAAPVLAEGSSNQAQVQLREQNGWKIIETDVITVLFPSGGAKPMFLWWYKNQTDKVYVVKYQGLYEFFAFDAPLYYYRHTYWAEWEWLRLRFMGMRWDMMPMELRMALRNVYENWHDPYLPFAGSQWQLSDIKNITADGKVIGLAFAFKLVKVPWWKPRFEFAENNIMIRARFYFEPVTEVVDGHEYTVNAGEMKQDIVISNWKWNLDTLKPLLAELRDRYNVTIPEGRTGLALAVNLASINVTRITPEQAETVENISTTSSMTVESNTVSVVENRTMYDETPILAQKRLYEHYRIRFNKTRNDTSLAGFFKFVSAAKVMYPDGSVKIVNVTAAYAEAGNHLKLFLGYPYFGNGTLEHDPSFGLDVPETTTPEATTPLYRVDVPSGLAQVEPRVLLPISTVQLAAIAVGAVTVIAVIIYAFKWKRKTPVNMVGTR